MKRSQFTVRHMVYCAISAALITICAWICVPVLQVSFTMQTFAVFFVLSLLGGRCCFLSVLLYLLLGAVGLPVFSGFQGGAGVLLGVTGGYIWGFLVAAFVYWIVTALFGEKLSIRLLASVLGMLLCYACGTAWYQTVYANNSLWAVLGTCVLPYLLPDGMKIALALYLAGRIKKAIPKLL